MSNLVSNLKRVCERLQENEELVDLMYKVIDKIDDTGEIGSFAMLIDHCLNELHESDFFGTEGQCDPRGDFRNGEFTVFDIEE